MTKPQPKPDDAAQFKRFKEAAERLGVSEDPKAIEAAIGKVVPEKRTAKGAGGS